MLITLTLRPRTSKAHSTADKICFLVADFETSNYFEEVIKKSDVKLSTNWITGALFGLLNEKLN